MKIISEIFFSTIIIISFLFSLSLPYILTNNSKNLINRNLINPISIKVCFSKTFSLFNDLNRNCNTIDSIDEINSSQDYKITLIIKLKKKFIFDFVCQQIYIFINDKKIIFKNKKLDQKILNLCKDSSYYSNFEISNILENLEKIKNNIFHLEENENLKTKTILLLGIDTELLSSVLNFYDFDFQILNIFDLIIMKTRKNFYLFKISNIKKIKYISNINTYFLQEFKQNRDENYLNKLDEVKILDNNIILVLSMFKIKIFCKKSFKSNDFYPNLFNKNINFLELNKLKIHKEKSIQNNFVTNELYYSNNPDYKTRNEYLDKILNEKIELKDKLNTNQENIDQKYFELYKKKYEVIPDEEYL